MSANLKIILNKQAENTPFDLELIVYTSPSAEIDDHFIKSLITYEEGFQIALALANVCLPEILKEDP